MAGPAPSGTPTPADFLTAIYGHGNGDVHLSTTNRQITAYPCPSVDLLAKIIEGKKDVYLTAAVAAHSKGTGTAGRVVDSDMLELTALWVDLDRAGEPGHKTKEANFWTRDDMKQLLDRLPIKPTAIVDSGGGWWLWFALTDSVALNGDGTGELLLARWARYWENIGIEFDRQVDSVFNPSRIARAPGSINTKEGVERPAIVKSLIPDRHYKAEEIEAFLPSADTPQEETAPEPVAGEQQVSKFWDSHRPSDDRPGDAYNREATQQSMVELLTRHGFHSPKRVRGRIDMTRPGKNARDGISASVHSDAHVSFWSSAPEGLPGAVRLRDKKNGGASGSYDPFGLYVALEHNGEFEAAARALNPTSTVILPAATRTGDESFWSSRPELERIRTYAQAQMAAPHAVLAVVLARVVCQTPSAVVLPDIIYDFASLNLTEALVADSGGGKGGSANVGAAAVHIGAIRFNMHTLGTGQGIAHGYAHHEKGETIRHADAVLFTVEEVDHLAAHNQQTGSTMLAELRRFGMGEKLGHLYVDPKRRIEIGAHSYRGAIVVAVQPARAGVLLDAADGGTPQRFYWVSTIDAHPPGTEPDRPEPWRWQPPATLPAVDRGLRPIPVCTEAADTIRQAQRDRRDGTGDPLDGHALLTRERLAAALGILNGRYEISIEDWQLAGHLIEHSDATRRHIVDTLNEKTRHANRQRGEFEAERSLIVTEAIEDAAIKRVARMLERNIPTSGDVTHSSLRKKLASRDRGHFDDAIGRLLAAGQITTVDSEKGTAYRKAKK